LERKLGLELEGTQSKPDGHVFVEETVHAIAVVVAAVVAVVVVVVVAAVVVVVVAAVVVVVDVTVVVEAVDVV